MSKITFSEVTMLNHKFDRVFVAEIKKLSTMLTKDINYKNLLAQPKNNIDMLDNVYHHANMMGLSYLIEYVKLLSGGVYEITDAMIEVHYERLLALTPGTFLMDNPQINKKESELTTLNGYKITSQDGDKSVMVEIRDDDKMPYDKNVTRAEIVFEVNGTEDPVLEKLFGTKTTEEDIESK